MNTWFLRKRPKEKRRMDLSNLKPAEGSVNRDGKRLGRGQGSGKGGTAARGHKGAKSRSGYSKKLGFEGMLVLHPKEIALAHQYFSPTQEEIDSAAEMLKLSEQAEKDGKGVAIMNGKFIGPPMVATAKNILNKANLIANKNSNGK